MLQMDHGYTRVASTVLHWSMFVKVKKVKLAKSTLLDYLNISTSP